MVMFVNVFTGSDRDGDVNINSLSSAYRWRVSLGRAAALASLIWSIASPGYGQGISQVGVVTPSAQVVYNSSNDFILASPCASGGTGCSGRSAVPAGTLLLACMWNFNLGYAAPPGSPCPTPQTNSALPITPPSGWTALDHLEQMDPYGNPANDSTLGGWDEFYLFYKIADGTEGNSYDFTTALCPEDQAGV